MTFIGYKTKSKQHIGCHLIPAAISSHRRSHILVHIVLFVLEVVVLCGGVLILLVFGDEIVHIALSLSELHLVHSLPGVPVQECFAAEHRSELLRHSFEHILNGGRVPDEGGTHFESTRWDPM